jgi:hypothetical protein
MANESGRRQESRRYCCVETHGGQRTVRRDATTNAQNQMGKRRARELSRLNGREKKEQQQQRKG